jgi:hypothetical protein
MNRPSFHCRTCLLIALAAIWGWSSVARAEQPPVVAPPPAESKSASPTRTKPQVIYHLPRSSTYAATLHSQAKGQSNALPIDSSMPTSLQMSRAAANEAAAQAQQGPSPSASNPDESGNSPEAAQKRTVKRVKVQSNRSYLRSHAFPKARGPGKSHGNKSHKR